MLLQGGVKRRESLIYHSLAEPKSCSKKVNMRGLVAFSNKRFFDVLRVLENFEILQGREGGLTKKDILHDAWRGGGYQIG